MLLSVFAYAWLFGWRYAVGFVLLIFVHEMGHYIAARQRGLDVGAPTFIPFVGAWIQLKDMPHNAETEAYIGIAGPVAGTLGALVCYYAGRNFDSTLLLALSYSGFFLNLFNLIPLAPFDGGRVTQVISPKLWLVGVPILIALFFYRPSPLLILVAILAAPQVWKVIRGTETEAERAYHIASAETKMTYGLLYLGLTIFLALMTHDLQQELPRGY
jgi:Zn-dependent protease